MMKIAGMYKWSGGTDYRHTCSECNNCITVKGRCKCGIYGSAETQETDWKRAYIACKYFNGAAVDKPVSQIPEKKEEKQEIEGQMSIEDFI